MKYIKECVTGNEINLKENNLGSFKQLIVDEFMNENLIFNSICDIGKLNLNDKEKLIKDINSTELTDFIKPFWMCLSLDNQEDIKENKIHFSCFLMLSGNDNKLMESLILSLTVLYRTTDINLYEFDDGYKLIIKCNGVPMAFIDDSNFIDLCECIIEISHFDKPKPEKKVEGEEELVRIAKEMENKYNKKKKDTLEFEEMIRQVMHYRNITYDELKCWTIWYLKDVYMVEIFREMENRQYLLSTNSNVKVDLKKIKSWKNETKLAR